jgi:hypothetical protein
MGELDRLLCSYLDECVPHRMSARTAGAHLAAIKTNFERSGCPRPDRAWDEPDRAQHAGWSRAPVPGDHDEVPAVHA